MVERAGIEQAKGYQAGRRSGADSPVDADLANDECELSPRRSEKVKVFSCRFPQVFSSRAGCLILEVDGKMDRNAVGGRRTHKQCLNCMVCKIPPS